MAALTVLLLAYCLVSALNARAAYHYGQFHLEYFEYVPWLPHSFDRERTWFCFWQYLGLAAVFWASRDWLLGRTSNKTQQELSADPPSTIRHISPPVLPRRLRRVLLVLCASGSLLAVESVVQRLAGSDKTLFFFQPNFPDADMVFGPFAYRGNASQYFNLVWPVCAVLAWTMGRASRHAYRVGARKPGRAHWWLAAGAILMGACPAISTCRGGAIVAGAQLVLVLCVLLGAIRPSSWQSRLGALLLVLLAVQAAMVLGLDRLAPRLEMMFLDRLSGRLDLYQQAERIAKDYPWFGTGPGSFALVYKFYRARPEDYWAAQAHDDWLETRVTFGWIGFITILLLLLLAPLTWLVGTGAGIRVPWHLPAALLVAMAGCLFHARFDFPLQIHSILALLVFYCAVLSCLEQRQARGAKASAPGGSQIH
jgi:O-antigen ligase